MRIFKTLSRLVLGAGCLMALASCDKTIYDDGGVCTPEVRFTYDWNMKFADAFTPEVRTVSLYVFDAQGKYLRTYTSTSNSLILDGIADGSYTFVALSTWTRTEALVTPLAFSVPALTVGTSTVADLTAKLAVEGTEVTTDINPLYHSYDGKDNVYVLPATVKGNTVSIGSKADNVIPMMKDTNSIRVSLQQISGLHLDLDDYIFTIESANTQYNGDNSFIADAPRVTYSPWAVESGHADIEGIEGDVLNVVVAEFTVGRLVPADKPMLTITNREGQVVFRIPVTDYLLLVKGNYNRQMTDQEYLDRQDEYTMTFFLDENGDWFNSRILINGWVIVRNNETLK